MKQIVNHAENMIKINTDDLRRLRILRRYLVDQLLYFCKKWRKISTVELGEYRITLKFWQAIDANKDRKLRVQFQLSYGSWPIVSVSETLIPSFTPQNFILLMFRFYSLVRWGLWDHKKIIISTRFHDS